MSNTLQSHLETYETVRSAIKVVRRVLDRSANPVGNTVFHGLTVDDALERLRGAEQQVEMLIAFAMFSAFERQLRDHLADAVAPVGAVDTVPPELARNLHGHVERQTETWRIDDVIEMFSPPVPEGDVGNAKGIRTYRHHVAHGAAPPQSMPPQMVYNQLAGFLRRAGLA